MITIRRATPEDGDAVAEMVREIAAHEDQAAAVHVDDAQWRTLLERPEVVVLLAERGGTAVGTSPPSAGCTCGPAATCSTSTTSTSTPASATPASAGS